MHLFHEIRHFFVWLFMHTIPGGDMFEWDHKYGTSMSQYNPHILPPLILQVSFLLKEIKDIDINAHNTLL